MPADNPILAFVADQRNPRSAAVYRSALFSFLDYKFGKQRQGARSATAEIMQKYAALAERYLAGDPNFTDDLKTFALDMGRTGIPPKTVQVRIAGTMEFIKFAGAEFTDRQREKIRRAMPLGGVQTVDVPLDHEDLRTILSHMPIRYKALVLFLASSGSRLGETLAVLDTDIDRDTRPWTVILRGMNTKGGITRKTFISKEASEAVAQWEKTRQKYMAAVKDKNKPFVDAGRAKPRRENDTRIFPFSDATAESGWKVALEVCGLAERDPVTKRLLRPIHSLRKFFLSQAKTLIPENVAEAFAGHKGYLSDAYRRYPEKQLRDFYLQAEPAITIMIPPELRELQGDTQKKLDAHSMIIEEMVSKNIQLEKTIGAMKEDFNILAKNIIENPEALRKNRDQERS